MRIILLFSVSVVFFVSCARYTRTETDAYTINERDTTYTYYANNSPNNRDNGIIHPSTKSVKVERETISRDSIIEREYPDFIRLGLFESVGIIGGNSDYAINTGMFGLFPDIGKVDAGFRGENATSFTGGIYRLGIMEYRLRWFRDSKNWTIGTSLFETLIPEARAENILMSALPIYVRKRYYLSEEIPYIALTPSLGVGLFPSQYLNLSGAFEVGSLGGLNLRFYAGYAIGFNGLTTPQIKNNDYVNEAQSVSFPYMGFGISFLDFHNLVPETYKEWKDHEHSSFDVGLASVMYLSSSSDASFFSNGDDKQNSFVSGMILKMLNSDILIPVLDKKLYAGASLFMFSALGYNEWGLGILPLRLGYWHQLLLDELSISPFVEFSFYPSNIFNIAVKSNLKISNMLNIYLQAGYITVEPIGGISNDIADSFGPMINFSRFYIGFGLSLFDRIFFPEQLRYFK